MKKILLLVFLFVLGKMSYSQGYPLTQNLGSDSTIVVSKGALQSRLIPIVITDTNAANAQRLKSYPGAQLYTTAGDFYIRNSNATKWILVSSGSSGSVNIYTADGTLTGNRTLTGANNNLTFTGLNKFTVSTGDTTLFNTNTFGIKGVGGVLNVEGTAAGTTSSLTLKTASDGNWTISTGQVNFNSGDLRFYDNDNGANRMIIKPSGNVGIGTETPDSLLTVNGGVYIGGGIRAPGLPTALGTKALRINAQGQISVADTTLGGGTVTSVGTNNGSGITGGPITTSGTLAIDTTNVIATKASVSSGLAGKLNISDTAAMLAPYLRAIDTASLSNRINLKLNTSDTASMLGNYLNNVGYGLSKVGQVASADSATLSAYYLRRKDSLTTTNPLGYVTKQILADTAAAIRSSSASGFVPYTGATQNVDLGQFGLKTKYVEFDTSSQAVADRRLQWSNDEGTLQFGMTNGATITQRLGLEQFARVKNVQGSQINKGQAVYIYGASGDRASVKLADNRDDSTSSKTLGVAAEDIPINGVGLVGTFGQVGNLNLSAFSPGNILYLDSVPGQLTATKPQAPYNLVFIGVVERANSGNGLLFVNPQNGYELEELHNVRITSPVLNNAILAYDSVAKLWKDTTLNGIGGVTGSGTTNRISKFTSSGVIGNSSIADSSSTESISIASDGDIAMGSTGANILNSKLRIRSNATSSSPLVVNNSSDNILFQLAENSSNGALVQLFDASNNNRIVLSTNAASSFTGGSLSVGTAFPDSMFQVTQGAYFQRGVRMSGLPSAPGTKALRIDASGTISIADTLIDAGGTVTSVATNNGTGITGGTITTSGTLAIDTVVISTRAWRQKGIDSVASLITGSYVPLSRTLTINGTSFDLSANRTWNVGTVTTAAASGGGQVAFFNGSTVITSVTGLYFDGTNKLAIGSSSPDSMLSVTQGAHIQRGVRLSGLPTAPGTRSLRIDANGTLSVSDTLANGMSGSGTPNYIPKFTGSNSIGNSVIYESSSNIGIGTISPNYPLHINSTSNARIGVQGTTNFSAFQNINSSGSLYWGIDDNAGANFTGTAYGRFIYSSGAYPLIFFTNSTERMRLDASGNLGIGTTSPTSISNYIALTINGTSGSFTEYQENGGRAFRIGSDGATGGFISQTSADPIRIFTSSTERMRITSGGNVGIGTTSPTELLQVGGSSGAVTTPTAIRLDDTYRTGGAAFDKLKFYLYKSATETYGLGLGDLSDMQYWAGTTSTGVHRFFTSQTERMRITSAGNVGIGTTSPATALEVAGSVRAYLNSATTTELFAENNTVKVRLIAGTSSSFLSTTTNHPLIFETNNAERMRITSGGDVGIGTTSPAGKLNINGISSGISVRMDHTASYSAFLAYINGTDYIGLDNLSGAMAIYAGSSERMRITSGGLVGIGTTSPNAAALLEVNSTSRGVLLPRMSGTQAEAILGPPDGLLIYCNNGNGLTVSSTGFWGYSGGWVKLN